MVIQFYIIWHIIYHNFNDPCNQTYILIITIVYRQSYRLTVTLVDSVVKAACKSITSLDAEAVSSMPDSIGDDDHGDEVGDSDD